MNQPSLRGSQNKPPPPANRKAYDGSLAVVHTIQEGESLSRIASIYRFPAWQPIWLYNSSVEQTLGDDPNLIRKGATIFIPRSKRGYQALIKKMTLLKLQLEYEGDRLVAELDVSWYELEQKKIVVNFAGEVVTLGASLYLKAATTAKLAASAERTVGQAKIAARLAARAEGRELAAQFAAVRGRLLKTALKDHTAMRGAQQGVTRFVVGKAVDTAVKAADSVLDRYTGQEDGKAFQYANSARKGVGLVKDITAGALTMVGA